MTRIEEIEERCKKATEGPLEVVEVGVDELFFGKTDGEGGYDDFTDMGGVKRNDAEFFTHAREDIPYLLSLIKAKDEALQNYACCGDGCPCEGDLHKIASEALALGPSEEKE